MVCLRWSAKIAYEPGIRWHAYEPFQITGLFCRISPLLQGSFAKETYHFIENGIRAWHTMACIRAMADEPFWHTRHTGKQGMPYIPYIPYIPICISPYVYHDMCEAYWQRRYAVYTVYTVYTAYRIYRYAVYTVYTYIFLTLLRMPK